MQGLKIRVLQTPGFVEAYRALGAQPTPMPYGELFLALQNGVVDAMEASPDAMVADRFIEVVDNYSLTKMHQSTTVFIVSKSFMDNLPEDLQEVLRSAAKDAIADGVKEHVRFNVEGMEVIRETLEVEEPDLAGFKTEARKSYDVILEGNPGAQELLAKIEAARNAQ